MSAIDAAKPWKYRERLREEWTEGAGRISEVRSGAEAEIFAELRKLSDGSVITMPLEVAIGTGTRP
jgi:hypothetical protein